MEQQKQPKIVQKLLLRTFFLLVTVAAVFVGIQYLLNWRKDPDGGVADTNQMIAAIELLPEGQQAVLFDSAGKKVASPDYEAGKTDRDITWRPDGNRLFFVSDRKEGAYHLFRWNPASGSVDVKSTGTLSKFDPSFPIPAGTDPASLTAAGQKALIIQGGFVLEYNILEATSQQLLPPPGGVTTGSEEGSGGSGQFDGIYKKFGNAFRTARWIGNGDYIAAIMKGDEQETLIIQKMASSNAAGTIDEQMRELAPRPLMAGDRVDIDVDAKTGILVFSVQNFQFPDRENIPPESIKNGRAVKPFANGLFIFDPSKPSAEAVVPIAISNEAKMAFGPPAISPDGTQVAVSTGKYETENFLPASLAVMPLQAAGMQAGATLLGGSIYEYGWHPTGSSITFIMREGKERAIYKINKDGSGQSKVSDGGNFMTPKFSPQSK